MKPTINLTGLNIGIVIAGTVIMGLGLYRIFPLYFNKQFFTLNGPVGTMLLIGIAILVWGKHEPSSFTDWGKQTTVLAGRFLPLIILLCLVMGIGSVITRLHGPGIQAFLERHHIVGPFVAAFLTPTSNALLPIVEKSWEVESLRPMSLYYLQASALMSLPLFMLRQIGFADGSPIPIKMYVMGLVVSVCILPLMRPIYWIVEMLCDQSSMLWNSLKLMSH